MSTEKSDQEILESTLDRALGDAVAKTDKAVESTLNRAENYERDVWAAAEASEYASLIYALAYNLEDTSTSSHMRKRGNSGPSADIRITNEALHRVEALRHQRDSFSILEAYKTLRQATDSLRDAYLSISRPRPST